MSKTVPIQEIPAVVEYSQAKKAMDTFIAEYEAVFAEFRDLVEHVNDARGRADKEVRSRKVSCGDWDLYQTSTSYDAKALYEAMGRDDFLKAGGKLNTITEYGVDKAKVDAAISRGFIPEEVAGQVKTKSPRYKAPKEITLP